MTRDQDTENTQPVTKVPEINVEDVDAECIKDIGALDLELNDIDLHDLDLNDDNTSPTLSHTHINQTAIIGVEHAGLRFDQVAALVFDQYSREKLKQWMNSGELLVDAKQVKPKNRCVGAEVLSINAVLQDQGNYIAQDIALDIVYEDEDIIIINKPVGLVVHPGAGHNDGTLINGLIFYDPSLLELPRAGLVHRIDKDTSGLLVVARNLAAQHHLTQQLAQKLVYRVYDAVVQGHVIAGGTIDEPIRRHSVDRTRMSVAPGGKPSVTHYRVKERYMAHTLLRVQLETGRTHQIRVHMAHKQFPLVGDTVYGSGRLRIPAGITDTLAAALKQFKRQALHARELGLIHPRSLQQVKFEAPWPADFAHLVTTLREEDEK